MAEFPICCDFGALQNKIFHCFSSLPVIWSQYFMANTNRRGKVETVTNFLFLGSKITMDSDRSHETERCLLLERKAMTNLDSVFKSRDITLPTKACRVKVMVFPVSHVWMWELDHKENWVLKNWCFQIVVLEKTLESPLDSKEIKPVNPKGNQHNSHWNYWYWSWRSPILWSAEERAGSLAKVLMLRKIEGRKRMEQQRMR